jgi:hypothetical protein
MKELFEHGTSEGFRDRMMAFEEFNRFIGLPLIRETERKYYEHLVPTPSLQGSDHGG